MNLEQIENSLKSKIDPILSSNEEAKLSAVLVTFLVNHQKF